VEVKRVVIGKLVISDWFSKLLLVIFYVKNHPLHFQSIDSLPIFEAKEEEFIWTTIFISTAHCIPYCPHENASFKSISGMNILHLSKKLNLLRLKLKKVSNYSIFLRFWFIHSKPKAITS